MKRPTKKELVNGIAMYESGFCRIGFFTQRGRTNILYLHNDLNGDGEAEYLHLKYEKDKVSVYDGSLLNSKERKMVWRYKDFMYGQDLIEAISDFAYKFSQSFELKLVRK